MGWCKPKMCNKEENNIVSNRGIRRKETNENDSCRYFEDREKFRKKQEILIGFLLHCIFDSIENRG